MSGILALVALTAAGAVGIRRLIQLKRRASSTTTEPDPVTPEAADRSVVIVDNGGRPFVVRLSYKRRVATVYRTRWGEAVWECSSSEVLHSFRYRRAFVGVDPRERKMDAEEKRAKKKGNAAATAAADATTIDAAAPAAPRKIWWFGGTSVLLDLGRRRYVFIGWVIYTFTAYDDIVDYVGTMGNSHVTYPFAVGKKNTYLMIEMTYIPNHILRTCRADWLEDPYYVLYESDLSPWIPGMVSKELGDKPKCPGTYLASWVKSFVLKDYTLLVDRQWD
ncbi:hypothetical protein VaNZ11_005119 [Volvox africanus]|uniref:Uncharacterized protein n=1 Tax=Volvox africanus TaxID=51714 RepID=A0ABQ5RZ61_9CHLO|nr:hypothetical protein VaNZ11_005119 [Volvox africanus]